MTPQARLTELCEILKEVFEFQNLPADKVLSNYMRQRRYMGSKDRRFFRDTLFSLLRKRGYLLFHKEKFPGVRDSFEKEVLLYAFFMLDYSLEDFSSLCSGEKYHLSVLLPEEKTFLKHLSRKDEGLPLFSLLSYPEEMEPFLKKGFGEEASEEIFKENLLPFLQEAPLDLRVNTLKVRREEVLAHFEKEGIQAFSTPYSPLGVRLFQRIDLSLLPLFIKGEVEVQEEGSQLVSFLVNPRRGERILDFCAGAGGKSLALAALMENKGSIFATDVNAIRLQNAKERFRRSGVHMVETKVLETGENDKWLKRQREKFDRVLVDVPCSGSGTWRRNPDQKWKTTPFDIQELQKLQGDILSKASKVLKKGGRLVYATCSLFQEENEDVIYRFLENNKDFVLENASGCFPDFLSAEESIIKQKNLFKGPFLKTHPAKTQTDGFFAAVVTKI